ncbi:MAG: hypothetical protein KatS3mg124_0229 [Porticoccaceae bacterium]|nr:MAG: hypothetical protein KatS3mg124_0229 [Porticoccaceae bacterium]
MTLSKIQICFRQPGSAGGYVEMGASLSEADRWAIGELLARAAHALDDRDASALEACFAEDAVMSLRIADGDLIGPFAGRAAIMKLMHDSWAQQRDRRRHVVSNLYFVSESPAEAEAISYLTLLATEDGQIALLSAGVYRDRLVRRDGRWWIARRHLDLDKTY